MDFKTAGIACAITQICLSLVLVGTYWLIPKSRFSQLWAAAGLLSPIGISLIMSHTNNGPTYFLILGNSFLFGANILFWVGLESFYQKNTVKWGGLYFAVYVYSYAMLLVHNASVSARAYHFSICLIWILGLSAKTLFLNSVRYAGRPSNYSGAIALAGLTLLILAHAIRAILIVTEPESIAANTLDNINTIIVYIVPISGTLLFFSGFFLIYLEQVKSGFVQSINKKNVELEDRKAALEIFSHEYRTPISVISANLDLLQHKSTAERAQQKFCIKRMQRALIRLIELSEATLSANSEQFSSNVRGWEPVNLASLIGEVLEDVRQLWFDYQPSLDFELNNDTLVVGDRNLLKTAFLNILENSIKYSPPNSQFRTTLSLDVDLHRKLTHFAA